MNSIVFAAMAITTATATFENEEFRWHSRQARAPRLRAIRQFAEDELVISEGKYEGRRYRVHRQPTSTLLLDAISDPRFTRFAITGCVQSGKTLTGLVLPVMYHLRRSIPMWWRAQREPRDNFKD